MFSCKKIIAAVALMLAAGGAEAQDYKIVDSDKPLTIESHGERSELLPKDARKGKAINATDYLLTKSTATSISLQTPKGEVGYKLPASMRIKVKDMVKSGVFSTATQDAYWAVATDIWDLFKGADEKKEEYAQRFAKEGGNTHTGGAKEGGYNSVNTTRNPGAIESRDKAKLEKMNDSLANKGVTDSAVYYLKNGFYLERNNYTGLAKDNYKNALTYARRNHLDTVIIKAINTQFKERMNAPVKSNEVDDFFKK